MPPQGGKGDACMASHIYTSQQSTREDQHDDAPACFQSEKGCLTLESNTVPTHPRVGILRNFWLKQGLCTPHPVEESVTRSSTQHSSPLGKST